MIEQAVMTAKEAWNGELPRLIDGLACPHCKGLMFYMDMKRSTPGGVRKRSYRCVMCWRTTIKPKRVDKL